MINDMSTAHSELETKLHFGLPDRLEKALKVSGVSSQEMADYLGVSRNTISNWTTGKRPVKKQSLRLWAMRTGVPMEWLEEGVLREGPPENDPKSDKVSYPRTSDYKADGSTVIHLFPGHSELAPAAAAA